MKQNYRQAKRQKELARKARQQEKQTKRATTKGEGEGEGAAGAEPPGGAVASAGEQAVVTPTTPTDGTGAA